MEVISSLGRWLCPAFSLSCPWICAEYPQEFPFTRRGVDGVIIMAGTVQRRPEYYLPGISNLADHTAIMSEHEHHHRHGEEHSHDYATANKEHFHKVASNEENAGKVDVAKRCARAILERYPFDENSTTVMDFACNTGLLSREIAGHTKLLVGVDITQAPVNIFNEHVSNQGIPLEKLRAVCVDLKGEEGELDGFKFDVITCAAAYHHFPDIDKITKTLTFFLKPGGFLFVVDIAPKETSSSSSTSGTTLFPEQYQHVVAHRDGLTQEALKGAFDGAGLVSFTFEPFSTVTVHEKEGILFIAKGKKPTS